MAQTVPGMHEIIKQILLEEIERYPDFKVSNSRHERTRQDQRTPAQADSHNKKEIA